MLSWVLRAVEEYRQRRAVHVWLVLECAGEHGHHCEQRVVRAAKNGSWKAPKRVKCSECLEVRG
jgi:hypothetical protein